MTKVNHENKEITARIAYYGADSSGKRSNLAYIRSQLTVRKEVTYTYPGFIEGFELDLQLLLDQSEPGHNAFLDQDNGFRILTELIFVPPASKEDPSDGELSELAAHFQLVDGIVFVVDSETKRVDDNLWALNEYYIKQVLSPTLPMVVQYNKRDLDLAMSVEDLQNYLSLKDYCYVEAIANRGTGVLQTLRMVNELVWSRLS